MQLEENKVYKTLPHSPLHVAESYKYVDNTLYCRNDETLPWRKSRFNVKDIIPWLANLVPEHLRVSEGL